MSEFLYRLRNFEENLAAYKGQTIYLYGTGKNACELKRLYGDSWHFAGLISPEPGSLERALEKKPDAVVIAAQMYAAEEVYQRIHAACRAAGVKLLDMYGTDQTALHDELAAHEFQDLDGWRAVCAGYDVISLELSDTLIEWDILDRRRGRVRPVFAKLIPELIRSGRRVLLIGAPECPRARYEEILAGEGLFTGEGAFDEAFFTQTWMENFFRKIAERFQGQRLLHIGYSLLENGIIPRLCGFDTYRMVFFDKGRLTRALRRDAAEALLTEEAGCQDAPDFEECLAMIRAASLVSFDIFDTLLSRQARRPEDVFALAARRAVTEGALGALEAERFVRARAAAQTGEETLGQIYGRIQDHLGLTDETVRRFKELELDAERMVIMPREGACRLLFEALRAGRRVILITDMYLTEKELHEILEENGITGYERIFSSCERGLLKRDGLIAQAVRESGADPDKAVHFGDSEADDGLPARRAGVRFARIPSPADMDEAAGIGPEYGAEMEAEALLRASRAQLGAYLLDGIRRARAWSDPFQPGPRRAAAAMAPVIAGWLAGLYADLEKAREDGTMPDGILFAARDGYALKEIYERTAPEDFPSARYFYSSRRAAFGLVADREDAAGYIAAMARGMEPEEALAVFFGVETDSPDEKSGTRASDLRELIAVNGSVIAENCARARQGYAAYLACEGLNRKGSFLYADFVGAGTSQRFLEEVSPFSMRGVYFGRTPGAPRMMCDIGAYIDGERSPAERDFLARYLEMEYYMTSPEPSLAGWSDKGLPKWAPEARSRTEIREAEAVRRELDGFFDALTRLTDYAAAREKTEYRELSGILTAEKTCACWLGLTRGSAGEHRYYDDWSRTWI